MFDLKDAALRAAIALPADAGSVYSDPIDLGNGPAGMVPDGLEIELTAPALDGTQLPAGQTAAYYLEQADDAAFSSPEAILGAIIVQTGAETVGGAEAAAWRSRLPASMKRFLRLKVTTADVGEGHVGNCSAAEAVLQMYL
jgi:hypothetical protein